jgi:hypothetical protein
MAASKRTARSAVRALTLLSLGGFGALSSIKAAICSKIIAPYYNKI